MAKANDIIAEIAAAIPDGRPRRWQDRVADEHQPTLQAIKEAYLAGKFGRHQRPAVLAIVSVLASRGIANIGRNGVQAWLKGE
jgi:hypothetical protein